MNILIVANHYAVCSARYAADAFTRLGHNVKHIGQSMGRNIWGMQIPEEYVWTSDEYLWKSVETDDANLMDVVIVMDSDPDVLDSAEFYHRLVNIKSPAPVVVWGVDNHCRDYRRPYFDHYFLAHKSVSVIEWSADMTWLPCAYDPVAFPPSPIAWADREFDVCMIGVLYPQRWQLVNAMCAAGLKVLAGTGLVYDAYRDAHWNSRVALVSSFNGDLPIRLFEGAGMGCAVVADRIADLALLGEISPIADYRTVDEAVSLTKELLALPVEIAEQRVMLSVQWSTAHTWDTRAQVILSWLEARA